MLDSILKPFRLIASPFLNWWHRLPLRWKGWITILLPITAIIVSSTFAFFGNQSRETIEADIQRKFALVSTFNDVLTLMVNAETGMRGYQLTKREEFLQPYQLAQTDLPAKLNALQALIEAEPGEKPRIRKSEIFNQIKVLIKNQMSDLTWQKDYIVKSDKFDDEIYSHIIKGKNYMDEIRLLLGNMESEESTRLSERISEINSIRKRDYFVVFLTLTIALITRLVSWYLFDTGISQRIWQTIDKIRELQQKEPFTKEHLSKESRGEMDLLEEEVEELCQSLNGNSAAI